jgi:PAS domain S-box-containing protein
MKETGAMLGINFQELIENCPEAVAIYIEDQFVYLNPAGVTLFRAPSRQDSILGKSVFEVIHPDYHETVLQRMKKLLSGERSVNKTIEEKVICWDGSVLEVEVSASRVTYFGKPAIQVVFKDDTDRRKTADALRIAEQELNELSAPLVPIMNQTAILPLIGIFNQDRLDGIIQSVPTRVADMKIHHLIIDCSGIGTFNKMVATQILQLQKILMLLGVGTAFTGIRPRLAQAAVHEGFDFSGIMTFQSVQQALSAMEPF